MGAALGFGIARKKGGISPTQFGENGPCIVPNVFSAGQYFVAGNQSDAFQNYWQNPGDYRSEAASGALKTETVNPRDIEGVYLNQEEINDPARFWDDGNGGTMASFVEIAQKVPVVQAALDRGVPLRTLMNDPDLGACASIYFSENNIPVVGKGNGFYTFSTNGRHRIIAAQLAGVKIPVKIGSTITKVGSETEEQTSSSKYQAQDASIPTQKYGTPMAYSETLHSFHKVANGKNEVYDEPIETGEKLYFPQGSAYTNFAGTCGLCSCANVLRLAGVDIGEKEMIDYAYPAGLCGYNRFDAGDSGGTAPRDRQAILAHFGIKSSLKPVTFENERASDRTMTELAAYVAEGRGVIISVDAGYFYGSSTGTGEGHAITVTSVMRDPKGNILGYYVCDSNCGTRYYNKEDLQGSMRERDMNVTDTIIR